MAKAATITKNGAVALAVGLWTTVTVAHLFFTIAIGGNPLLLAFPFVWCLHGLLLTWPLQAVIARAQSYSSAVKWAVIGLAVVGLTLAQTWLDGEFSRLLARFMFDILRIEPFTALLRYDYGYGERSVGFQISLMIYFWVFGCYAVASNLLAAQAKAARSEAQAHQARLMALHLQLSPHLLFNALNSISSLIMAGENIRAENANQALSGFLRRTLEFDPMKPVPVMEELDMIDAFLEIERLRFGDRLDVVFEAEEDTLEIPVPPFILQPLVENAVKHGAAPGRSTRVIIRSRREGDVLLLSVGNSRVKAAATPGTRTGLRNVQARLGVLYGERAELQIIEMPDTFEARVFLPTIA